MKKVLLGTTALIAASMVAGTVAQAEEEPISLGIGGYYRAATAVLSEDSDDGEVADNVHNVQFDQDIELTISGSTTLDNGLTVGASMQLEGATVSNSESSSLDERFIFFRGSFGMARIGATESARQEMTNFAPNGAYNFGVNTPFFKFPAPNNFAGFGQGDSFFYVHTYDDDLGVEDTIKVLYFSPTFNGFSLGVSYAPDDDEEGAYGQGTADDTFELQDQISISGEYSHDFEDFNIRVAAGYERYTLERCGSIPTAAGVKTLAFPGFAAATANLQNCKNDPDAWHVGGTVNFGAISIGGGYLDHDGVENDINGAERDRADWDIGISYWTALYGLGLQWGHAQSDMKDGFEDEIDRYVINGTYVLGPGIDVQAQAEIFQYDDASPTKPLENDAVVFALGSALAF